MTGDTERVPSRYFLDSSTLQTIYRHGEFIFDGGSISLADRIRRVPNGMTNLEALRDIMALGQRGGLELAVSPRSLEEAAGKHDGGYVSWVLEMADYWDRIVRSYTTLGTSAYGVHGTRSSSILDSGNFGYLSRKDKGLLRDALQLDCGGFLTMDRRLCRNAAHLERNVPLKLLEPARLCQLVFGHDYPG